MKKILIGVAVVLVLLVAGVLAAPTFIDWNQYKGRLAQEVEQATGRQLQIGGDLSLSLLPRTVLRVEDVRLASLPDAVEPTTAHVRTLEVHVDAMALLRGAIRVESITLISPRVVLERLADGRATWEFITATEGGAEAVVAEGTPVDSTPAPGSAGTDGGGLALRLDRVTIQGGELVFRDAVSGAEERLWDIDMELAAESLRGPFRAEGSMTARDVPVFVKTSLGALAADRASPMTIEVALSQTGTTGRFSGVLTAPDAMRAEGRSLRGDMVLTATDLQATAAVLGQDLPAQLAVPGSLEGELALSAERAELDGLRMSLRDSEATGSVAVDLAARPIRADIALGLGSVSLDEWLAATVPQQAPTPTGTPTAPPTPLAPTGQPTPSADPRLPAFPEGLTASLDITAEALIWRDNVIREAVLSAALDGGELTLNQVSARLPGNSNVLAFGMVRQDSAELSVEARSDNLRAVLEWLGLDVSAVPGGRLGRFEATAGVSGTVRELAVRNLDVTVDTTSLRGAATVRPGLATGRPAVGATVVVGSLNLDAYLPQGDVGAPPAQGDSAPGADDAQPAQSQAAPQQPPLFAGLGFLNEFDANIRADAETVTFRTVPLHDVRLDASLLNGTLTFRDSGIGAALGASARVSGGVSGFGGAPRLDDLAYGLRIPEPGRLARAMAVTLPVSAARLGVVGLDGRLSGSLETLGVIAELRAAGGVLAANGTVRDALSAPSADLAVEASHADTAALLATVAPDVRLNGPLGAFGFSGRVRTGGGDVGVGGMTLDVGDMRLEGDVTAKLLAAPRPLVEATVRATLLDLDRLMPVERTAALPRRTGPASLVVPASMVVPTLGRPASPVVPAQAAGAAPPGPWSTEPLDLSALMLLDGSLNLTADALVTRGIPLRQAEIVATLQDGTLSVGRLAGTLFGGALNGTATVAAQPQPGVGLSLDGTAMQLAQALNALTGRADAEGDTNFTLSLNGQGGSTLALAESLQGEGTLTIRRLNVAAGAGGGGAGQALLGPVAALNQLAALGAGRDSIGELLARYRITDGLVDFETLQVKSALYDGQFTGGVDLPRWTVDIEGEARLAPNMLTALLGSRVALPENVPVTVTGSLDDPRVGLPPGLTGGAPRSQTPPAQALPRSPEDAARRFLEGLAGRPAEAPRAPADQPPPDQPPPEQASPDEPQAEQQAPRPEDILRGILQGLPRR